MPLLGPEDVEESDFQGMSERLVLEAIESRGNLEVSIVISRSYVKPRGGSYEEHYRRH